MSELLTLRAQVADTQTEEGVVQMRLVPFGEEITHHGKRISFARGGIRHAAGDHVPVNLEHSPDAMDRIGLATSVVETDEALFASVKISDTTLGRDTYTLLRDGVLRDVSAGVLLDGDFTDGQLTGQLDHIAITGRGAFGDAGAGSRVLSVLSKEETREGRTSVGEENQAPEVSLTELESEVSELRSAVAQLSVPGAIKEPQVDGFSDLKDFVVTLHAASRGDGAAQARMAEFALAGDTTTGAAGLVPDYRSQEIISVIAESRPYVSTLPSDPIGDAGMTLVYPKVTQKPTVEAQATENTEVGSQSFTVADAPFDILTYAGANLASRQVVERSAPSYVEAFFAEMAGVYAQTTEAAAIAAGVAGAADTAILADLGADAALTWAAFAAASGAIATGVRRPATDAVLATDRWIQLMSLTDADGRPMVVFPEAGPSNAQGIGDLTTMVGVYGGLRIHHAPDAAVGTCLIYNRTRFQSIAEQSPVQLRAEVVSTLSWELGVYGLFVPSLVKYPAGGSTLTLV